MNEESAAALFIGDQLKADAAVSALVSTRIFEDLAPQGTPYPLVEFALHSPGRDRTAPGADLRMMSRALWRVKAITQGSSYAAADAIASAIDAALLSATGSIVIEGHTYTVLSLVREAPLRMPETTDGTNYRHVGGLYRVQVTSRS